MKLSCFPVWFLVFFLFHFTFPSHSVPLLPGTNVTLYGDAYIRGSSISLTHEFSCPSSPSSSSSSMGRALYVYPVRFLDPKANTTASFTCRFSFSIIPNPMCSSGDGIAFLITSSADSFSLHNGYMGLPEPNFKTQESFIAVEFDTNYDPSLGDINGNHIGVDVNTVLSFASVDVVSKGIDLKSGRQITVWIEYKDAVKLVKVWVGYTLVKPRDPVLVVQIDLSKEFYEYMHVGFSASSGQGSAMHIIENWRFRTWSYPAVNPVDTVEEGYCFLCSPEDSSNKTSPVDHPRKKGPRVHKMALGLGGLAILIVSVVSIVGIISVCVIRKKRVIIRKRKEREACRVQTSRVPTRLSLTEIRAATMGFSRNKIVGEGASATVYKGSLPSGVAVAVKRFDRTNRAGLSRNPFTTEFATMAGYLRHKNLVQLQGWCCEGSELVLVYEYLPNGSLDKLLHNDSTSTVYLSWGVRMNIVLGVASALTYLHEECERQIIHRDVKSCNIMLDDEFNAKLGDFGLAEVYDHRSVSREATIPAGTMGYLAPEYVYCGVPTEKTDVYSFGVVVLEVATGRRPVDDDGTVLVDWVWDLWVSGKLIEAADCMLAGRYNVSEMERMLMVGLSCVHPNHEKRPTVKQAVRIIKGEAPLPLLPVRKPTVSIRSVMNADSEEMLNSGDQSPGCDEVSWLTPKSHFS
ncbi:hypothetical protein SLEP1_g4591 [Rubroshorea leprosula]|uniref:non-specific serine/threonine protein kinase n=1 Tax=Rubroshorea leprosula TaxID=152421 RepID=A0AAV5HPN0_9ROSI|nr:hypothetical protein SLEP1_g4591 [Rubroshorea leprosula]